MCGGRAGCGRHRAGGIAQRHRGWLQGRVAEEARAHRLQLAQALAAENDQSHRRGVVVRGVEGPQRLTQIDASLGAAAFRTVAKCGEISRAELGERVAWRGAALEQLHEAPCVALSVLSVLGVDGVQLAPRRRLGEARRDEELREAVQRLGQRGGVDIEVIVGVLVAGERVASAAVLADEGLVRPLLRVLVGPEEEHVLAKVREARQRRRVGRVAHAHIHGGSGLIRLRVRDEHGRQLATWAQAQVAVLTVVERRLADDRGLS